ncbi:MAG TPA: ABC transporter permease [Thermoanaerobaculia bacterium]|nr:ABC transporter permease [Thermoanaerobaculia bacterium]
MNRKTFLVAHREFVENLRTKAFWIGILLFPVLITAMMVIPAWLERAKGARSYAVVDHSGWLLDEIERRAELPDLERVLERALELQRSGSPDFAEMPDALRRTAQELERGIGVVLQGQGSADDADREEVEHKLLAAFASTVGGLAGTQGEAVRAQLPPEAVRSLDELRVEIQAWWRALPPDQADEYGSGLAKSRYIRVEVADRGEAAVPQLTQQVQDGELFAYFVIGDNPVEGGEGSRYISTNLTDDDLHRWFTRLASDAVRDRRLAERAIEPEVAEWIQQPVDFAMQKIGAGGEEEEVKAQDMVRQWAPTAFVYLLWITVFTVAQMLLTNTVEEKSNRLMEVLLSSASPLQLMMGKIAGIAATGLTMLGSWVVFFYLATKYVPAFFGVELDFDLSVIATDPLYIGSFLFYFLLGYLFYAALLVGIGSVCNSLKEAQNLMTPVTLILFVPLATMIPISRDPNGMLAKVLSYVPPFTPFVMMNRAAGPPSTLEYVLTTALMLVSVVLVMWAAAKVFRIGVLMTGKPPRLREILRWLRAPVGMVPESRPPA